MPTATSRPGTCLYNYAAQSWKAPYWVREVLNRLYHPTPDGYCGDEDNGQTSAWDVFSALGFYPVCPATDQYVLGAPLFPRPPCTCPAATTWCCTRLPTQPKINTLTD